MPRTTSAHRASIARLLTVALVAIAATSCGPSLPQAAPPTTSTAPAPVPTTAEPLFAPTQTPPTVPSVLPTTTSTTIPATTTTSTTSTTTTSTTTTSIAAGRSTIPAASTATTSPPTPITSTPTLLPMSATGTEFDRLARANAAASLTVRRDGDVLVSRASGTLVDGGPATPDSPMLVASVSKVVTALTVAKLEQAGAVALDRPVAWVSLGLEPHPGWNDVTVRELLDHTSGMPVVRTSWFTGVGDCRSFLPTLLTEPPRSHRGTWRYSNGNYCALGLLTETLTGEPLDVAAQRLVFDAVSADGVHLSTDGLRPTDVRHGYNVDRLSRLGGAGTFVVSTDDLTALLAAVTVDDLRTLQPPAMFTDQYGWGHTGTVQGAISCLWSMEGGRTVVAVTIAGNSPAAGGSLCDRFVPAVARDLGVDQGRPSRTP